MIARVKLGSYFLWMDVFQREKLIVSCVTGCNDLSQTSHPRNLQCTLAHEDM